MRDHQKTFKLGVMVAVFAAALFVPLWAQDAEVQNVDTQAVAVASNQTNGGATPMNLTPGEEYTLEGFIVARDADTLTILTQDNETAVVQLNDQTEVREKKSNPFRSARVYTTTDLLPGLRIQVEGTGDGGRLAAEKIKFTQSDYETAKAIETRITPVQRELAETRQNAERLSGQVSELSAVSNAARGGATAAQETADKALGAAQRAQGAAESAQNAADEAMVGVKNTNDRIVSLDNFDVTHSAVVNFRVDSAELSDPSKARLDEVAKEAGNEKGFIVEVLGFASAEGNAEYNRRLSERRADAVVRYLVEHHQIPLRRIVTPFGYGALDPVADNKTRAGREQNRRVEVRILVSRGIQSMSASVESENAPQANLLSGQDHGQFQNQNSPTMMPGGTGHQRDEQQ
jgi:outer membrane protein OmpA-like peptidoglycan-associated protein